MTQKTFEKRFEKLTKLINESNRWDISLRTKYDKIGNIIYIQTWIEVCDIWDIKDLKRVEKLMKQCKLPTGELGLWVDNHRTRIKYMNNVTIEGGV